MKNVAAPAEIVLLAKENATELVLPLAQVHVVARTIIQGQNAANASLDSLEDFATLHAQLVATWFALAMGPA